MEKTNSRLKSLYSAARDGQISKLSDLIVASKLSKEKRCNWYYQAVIDKQKEVAQWLLFNGFSHGKESQQTREGFAANKAKDELIEMLMKKIAKADDFPASLFMDLAVTDANEELVSFLLNRGADVNYKVRGLFTAIHLAVMMGHSKVVEVLLARKASVHAMFKGSTTLLHAAVIKGEEDTVALLLKYGAQVNTKKTDGSTPLSTALEKGFLRIAKRLIDAGSDVNATIASTSGEMDPQTGNFIKYQMSRLQLDDDDSDDWAPPPQSARPLGSVKEKDLTLLHYFAYCGDEKTVELLVTNGAYVNALNAFCQTPLYFAAIKCHERVVKLLRDNGAKIEYADLLYIASGECLKSAKLLLKYGADVNVTNEVMHTPLHIAAAFSRVEMTNLLLKYGADTDAKNAAGWTPLVTATYHGHLEVVNALLRFGASANSTCLQQDPAFQKAMLKRHTDLMWFFIAKLKYDVIDVSGLSMEEKSAALLNAAENCHRRSVELLLQSGADVNSADSGGRTALHIAATNCYHEIVEILLDYGADTELKVGAGRTALFLAVLEPLLYQMMGDFAPSKKVTKQPPPDRLKTVKALLNFGADMYAVDDTGMTPLKAAAVQHEKQPRVLAIFLKFGSVNAHIVSETDVRSLFEEANRDEAPSEFHLPRLFSRYVYGYALTASEVLVKHAVLMKTAGIYAGKKVFFAKKFDHPDVNRRFQRNCEIEVRRMKHEKVGNTDVTFYDILKSDVVQMMDLAKNENIARALNGYDCEEKFELYGAILNGQFEKVKVRDFLKKGVKTCHFLLNRIHPVSYELAKMLAFRYLGRKHLRILTEFAVDLDLGFELFKHVIQT